MPTIVGILTFMSGKNFMLSCVEHEKKFWFKHIYFVLQLYKHTNIYDDNTSYGIRTEAKNL